LIVVSDPMIKEHRRSLVSLVSRYRIPAIFDAKDFVDVGGLMSFGPPVRCWRDFDGFVAYLDAARATKHPVGGDSEPELIVNRAAAEEISTFSRHPHGFGGGVLRLGRRLWNTVSTMSRKTFTMGDVSARR
jgi:hypothetical protein